MTRITRNRLSTSGSVSGLASTRAIPSPSSFHRESETKDTGSSRCRTAFFLIRVIPYLSAESCNAERDYRSNRQPSRERKAIS